MDVKYNKPLIKSYRHPMVWSEKPSLCIELTIEDAHELHEMGFPVVISDGVPAITFQEVYVLGDFFEERALELSVHPRMESGLFMVEILETFGGDPLAKLEFNTDGRYMDKQAVCRIQDRYPGLEGDDVARVFNPSPNHALFIAGAFEVIKMMLVKLGDFLEEKQASRATKS